MKFSEMFQYSVYCVLVCAVLMAYICESRIYTKQMGTRTIKTRYGDLRGALVEFWNQTRKPVEAFRGLQYGTTYAGRMRFMPPTSPLERWKYTRLAFSMRPICPQKNYKEEGLSKDLPKPIVVGLKRASPFTLVQSEDCLSLNIYVPVQVNSVNPMPHVRSTLMGRTECLQCKTIYVYKYLTVGKADYIMDSLVYYNNLHIFSCRAVYSCVVSSRISGDSGGFGASRMSRVTRAFEVIEFNGVDVVQAVKPTQKSTVNAAKLN